MQKLISLAITLAISAGIYASEIKEILPLTSKILMVRFDDGTVTYPNTLNVNRLDLSAAGSKTSWSIKSDDDQDFSSPVNPRSVGRKSKGTEFVKDAPWGSTSSNPTSKPWASEHYIYLQFDKPLKTGKTYLLNSNELATNGDSWSFTFDETKLRSEAVHVNTIGYASDAPKYGYVYHWMGDLEGLDLSGYSSSKFSIYLEGNPTPVKQGTIRKRKSSANVETGQSNDTPNRNFIGAEVYDCDFSDITQDGIYYLVVEGIGRSFSFKIGSDALFDAYYNVMRGLYHQRSGIRLAPPYTQSDYIRPVNQNTMLTSDDGTSFAGKLLYSDYPFTSWAEADGGGSSKEAIRNAATGKTLDVAGWYHDAGDWDQYFTHERIPILLMLTYELSPERFCDADLNIPESGNGIPDIIDEASWLIKFNYRLRKELKAKGYSNGGVGGARICADVYTEVDGNAESSKPSWKESRHTVVTKADAFMTYLYAGQASQYALILKKLGKNPWKFPVEMLDHVDFDLMSKDSVNWIKEAEEAYQWASMPENQPANNNNFSNKLEIYKLYAAVNLFRITGKEVYHSDATVVINELKSKTTLSEDERWGVYSYLLANNQNINKLLQTDLKALAISTADNNVLNAVEKRACRWGGNFDMPMLVGQATTPWIFEAIVAYKLTGDIRYKNAIHTTTDYFLGSNPLNTSWITGVGPKPAEAGFHLDSRYNHNWIVYPGFIPYGPWSMAYGYTPYTYIIDGVSIEGGHGSWNKDWANFSQYPLMSEWPGHERWNSNIHAPLSTENTVHQNTVYGGLTYGYANSRHNTNAAALKSITSLTLGNGDFSLPVQGQDTLLFAYTDISDASFAELKWKSSDPRIASVDDFGRVTGVTSGNCIITVSTLDESVSASCNVTCSWAEVNVESISIDPDTIDLIEGQKKNLIITFLPADASNKFIDWSFTEDDVVRIDENGVLHALKPGNVMAIASSLNGSKKDTCYINVRMAVDYIIGNFDDVIPVTTDPQPDIAQLYTPNGTNDIAFANPLINAANPSEKVVRWNRPAGDWVLIGMVLPTDSAQDLNQFAQFQFKYYGSAVKDFLIQLIADDESKIEINESIQGEDCWQLFTYDLNQNKKLAQFNVFANKTGNPSAIPILFDDFLLAGKPAQRYDNITISQNSLELNSLQSTVLTAEAEGHPYSWVSSDPTVATVDQEGMVNAISGGTAIIKAVPLYGNPAECTVIVDGGTSTGIVYKIIADFEEIEVDWTGGYGVFGWSSDSVLKADNPLKIIENNSDKTLVWKRDGTNLWAGFGLVFPVHNTTGWDFLSFQILATEVVNTIRIEVKNGDVLLGSYQLDNLGIQTDKWTTVTFVLTDIGISGMDINTINFQPAGGSDAKMLVYTDNILLRTKGEIKVTGISITQASPVSKFLNDSPFKLTALITPTDATNKEVEWSSSSPEIISVDNTGEIQINSIGSAYIIAVSKENFEIRDSVLVVVDPPLGDRPDHKSEISVFPNPFEESVYLSNLNNVEYIELTNVLGTRLRKIDTGGEMFLTIQTSELPSGIYFIRFFGENGHLSTRKIIRK